MSALDLSHVAPGFADPVHHAQSAFRSVMDAMARPGQIRTIEQAPDAPPAGLDAATAAIALTLLDLDTPLWLDPSLRGGAAETFIRFHCGCPLTSEPQDAAFAIAPSASVHARLTRFSIGSEKYPDRSTTLIWLVPSLTGGPALTLRGPGIRATTTIAPQGLPDGCLSDWRDNQSHFQCGVDLILTSGRVLLALPRSASISEARG